MGEYWLWKLLRRQASAKLNESRCSLCSFFGGARYLGRGMGSPGLYTLLGHRSWESVESVLESVSSLTFRERLKKALARARIGIVG
jgi:hypothetical protein